MHQIRSGSWPMWGWLAGLGLSLACGCTRQDASGAAAGGSGPARYPYRITATVGMVTDIVRQVAGDQAEVQGLIGEGVDPHLYKPTRADVVRLDAADVVRLDAADVVFYNGLMLEGKMGDVLERLARGGKPVFAVTQAIAEQGGYVQADESGHQDPHVWMDVGGWIRAVEVVAERLAAYDPANADGYRSRAANYIGELRKLDAYARQAIGSIPPAQRVLVTAHDAFNYMGRAYGLEVRGIQGISTESEAGVQDIENLVQFLVDRKIPAVFVESSVADKNIRSLVEGTQARGHSVSVGGQLFSDAMGPAGSYEGTYIGMIDHNVTAIARGLGGEAPPGGMQGKLSPGR